MVVDPILAGLVRIVKRGEGHVGAFAGDAVLCYFGAPVAHEDDAARAVRCAHEMLAEFPALLAVAPRRPRTSPSGSASTPAPSWPGSSPATSGPTTTSSATR